MYAQILVSSEKLYSYTPFRGVVLYPGGCERFSLTTHIQLLGFTSLHFQKVFLAV